MPAVTCDLAARRLHGAPRFARPRIALGLANEQLPDVVRCRRDTQPAFTDGIVGVDEAHRRAVYRRA